MNTFRNVCVLLAVYSTFGCAIVDSDEDGPIGAASEKIVADTWQIVSNPSTTDATPESVSFSGRLYLFAKGISDHKVYVNSTPDGDSATWTGWSVLGTFTTNLSVAPVAYNGKLYVLGVTSLNNSFMINSTADGLSWSGWVPTLAGATTDQAPRATVFNLRLYVAAKGIVDNGVYVISTSDVVNWGSWSASLGTTDRSPEIIAAPDNSLAMLIVHNPNGKLYRSVLPLQSVWQPWTAFGFPEDATSGPVRAAVFGNEIYVMSTSDGTHEVKVTASRVCQQLNPKCELNSWSDWFEMPTSATAGGNLGLGLPTNLPASAAAHESNLYDSKLYLFTVEIAHQHIYEEAMPTYHMPFSGIGWTLDSGNWDDPIATGHTHIHHNPPNAQGSSLCVRLRPHSRS